MRNHDWPKFPRDMWCSVAFLWGYHSFPLLLCEVLGGVIRGCKMFPRICYPMFWGYQFISPGFWGGFGDIKCEKPVRGKIRKMSFRQNDCTGKKTFWKARFWITSQSHLSSLSRSVNLPSKKFFSPCNRHFPNFSPDGFFTFYIPETTSETRGNRLISPKMR